MDVIFQAPLTLMLIVGATGKLIDLIRAPHDRVLRTLVACLILLASGQILSFPDVSLAVDAATAVGVGKIAFNAVHLSGLGALLLVFLSSMPGPDAAYRRQVRRHAALLAGVVTALVIAMIATPPALRGHTLTTAHMAQPATAAFHLLGNASFVYAYLAPALWAVRYARLATRPLAVGLRVMALGLFVLAVTSVNRVIWVCLRIDAPGSHQALNTVNWSMNDWALGLVLIGLTYSAGRQLAAHVRSVVPHRRMYRELTPLWTALAAAYPELVLNVEPHGSRWRPFPLPPHPRAVLPPAHQMPRRTGTAEPLSGTRRPGSRSRRGPGRSTRPAHFRGSRAEARHQDPETALTATRIASPAGNDLNAEARELAATSRASAKGHREQGTDIR